MSKSDEGAAFGAGFMIGIALGALVTGIIIDSVYKDEAIKRGAAHYDAKTGDWQWNDAEKLKK